MVGRIGAYRTMVAGLACFTIGTVWMSLISRAQGTYGYVLPIGTISVGYAFFQTPNTAAVMADARPDRRGTISGLLALARNLGLITGASLMGALFATAIGTRDQKLMGQNLMDQNLMTQTMMDLAHASPDAITGGMQASFRVAAAMGIAALALATLPLAGLALSRAGGRKAGVCEDSRR
jgi:MFS family permease